MQPKISIITCVYNTADYLEQCLDSVLAQQFTEWELILVDDGSTDRTPAICDRYAQMDDRIRVIHKPNSGLSDSRNLGIKEARADLISFIDSDDWIEPDMFRIVYDSLQANNTDIAIVSYAREYKNLTRNKYLGDAPFVPTADALKMLLTNQLQSYACNKVFHRKVLVEPMPVGKCYEDYFTTYKWFARAKGVTLINKPLYHYRQRQSSICNDKKMVHRRMDHFQADQERCTFCQANGMEALGKHMLVTSGIRVAKDIARCDLTTAEKQGFVSTIADAIRPHAEVVRKLSLKKRFRYSLICNHPLVFIEITRLSGVWMRFKKGHSRVLYP